MNPTPSDLVCRTDDHYLKRELYRTALRDPAIFDFLQEGFLDGIWYWDLERPENEWMSPRFWEAFGYEPGEKPHLSSSWQDMINHDDLIVALDNFNKHCADPQHPYDQVVRYTHKSGKTIWVRCRGMAIRDEWGEPVRMLGAHTDLTELIEAKTELQDRATARAVLEQERTQHLDAATRSLNTLQSRLADHIDPEVTISLNSLADAIAYLREAN